MKEGRATLMCLRRAVAGAAGHGHRFLSLTDNMSSLLAFDRGRSCSYDLLCLCRRAAALCIEADVSWVFRHLEAWRNPSDEGSRRARGFGRGSCGALPSHSRLNMFLDLWVFRFVSTLSRHIPRNPLRVGLAVLALSMNSVMAIPGSRPLFGDEAPMSRQAAP